MHCRNFNSHSYELLQVPKYDSVSAISPLSTPPQQHNDPRQILPTIHSEVSVSSNDRSVTFLPHPEQQNTGNLMVVKSGHSTQQLTVSHKHAKDDLKYTTLSEGGGLEATSSTSCVEHTSPPSSLPPTRVRSGSMMTNPTSLSYGPETRSALLSNDEERKEFGPTEQNFLDGLVQPSLIVTAEGHGSAEDLFLPPPPTPDISHLLSGAKSLESDFTKANAKLTTSTTSPKRKGRSPSSPTIQSSPSRSKKKAGSVDSSNSSQKPEKLLQPKREKYCYTGGYNDM